MRPLLYSIATIAVSTLAACGHSSSDNTASVDGGGSPSVDSAAIVDSNGSPPPLDGQVAVGDTGVADGGAPVDAGPPRIRYVARLDTSDPLGPKFAWSGSTAIARFTGPTVGVTLVDFGNNQFDVLVDGTMQPTLKTMSGQTTYPIASGLAAGPHTLEVYRRTEAFGGDTQVIGLSLDPTGALLAPPLAPNRRIEVVGDSISCGYGDEGMGPNCSFSYDTEDHYVAYEAVAARNLGADLITTAWSGKGMYRNGDNSTTDVMPELYLRTLPDQTTSTWDFSTWIPDAVVINLATNDFAMGDPGQPFVDAYLAFAHLVRMNYPMALIVCTLGPMLTDPNLTIARGYVNSVVTTMTTAGDHRVQYLEFPPQSAANGLGCDYHPSVTTHQMMAAELQGALQTALGW